VPEDRVEIRQDVVFGTGNGRDLRCDVYTPPGDETQRPGVLLIHGGGWRAGDKTQLRGYGILLGRAGYVCVISEYRLVGESAWPAQVHDVKAAVRWMRANAEELGIDPERIALEGNSAGAHVVLFAAGTPNVAEFEGDGGNPGISTSVGAVIGVYPPTMLVHGTADEVVPVSASFLMYDTLTNHKVPTELHVYAGQPHAFDADPRFGRRTADLMLLFLERYLKAIEPAGAPA